MGKKKPTLTYGACRFLDYQHYRQNENPLEPLILQVHDIARLKYSDCKFGHHLRYGIDLPYHVYRFILSDGSHLAPARMFTERMARSDDLSVRDDSSVIDAIEEMIQTGQLEIGCIVQVFPRRQHYSRGIMVLNHLRVLHPKIDFIRCFNQVSLLYVHCTAKQFSPHNRHHCTMAIDEGPMENDPLPREVLLFARCCEKIYGCCLIAGGSCLEKHIDQKKGCMKCYRPDLREIVKNKKSGDVDIWLPWSPRRYARSRGRLTPEYNEDHMMIADPEDALNDLFERFGIDHTPLTKRDCSRSYMFPAEMGWVDMFAGVTRIYDFKLVGRYGEVIERPVQLILIDTLAERKDQPWSETVTSHFDIDIIRNYAIIEDSPLSKTTPGPHVSKIAFLDNWCDPTRTRTFNYTLRPCQTPKTLFKRIVKYRKRGFKLASLSFDPRCTEQWINHVCDILRIIWAERWINDWCDQTKRNLTLPLRQKIMDYVVEGKALLYRQNREHQDDPTPQDAPITGTQRITNILERRNMMHDMILQQLAARRNVSPAGHTVNITKLQRAWKIADNALREGMTVREYLEWQHIDPESDSDTSTTANLWD